MSVCLSVLDLGFLDQDQQIHGEVREAGEGRRRDIRQGLQGAGQDDRPARRSQEDPSRNGRGRNPTHSSARSISPPNALPEHLRCPVRSPLKNPFPNSPIFRSFLFFYNLFWCLQIALRGAHRQEREAPSLSRV